MNIKHKKRIFSKAISELNNAPLKRHRKKIHGKSISIDIKNSKNIAATSTLTNDFEALLDFTTDKYAKVWEALA